MGIETGTAIMAGSALSVVGGLVGQAAASSDRAKAAELQQQALQTLMDAGAPPDVAKQLVLREYTAIGAPDTVLEPAAEKLVSKMQDVQTNQKYTKAQESALRQLQNLGQTGLTDAEKMEMMNAQDAAAQQAQQNRAAVVQNLAQRGMAGSGAEIAAQIAGNQAAQSQGQQNARNIMAQASQNALNAISQAGTLGTQLRGQEFQEKSAKAQAADEMNRFNVQNQTGINSRNTAQQNSRNLADWQNKQTTSNNNTNLYNNEQQRQNQAKQWMYNADLTRRGAQSTAQQSASNFYQNQGNATAGQWAGIGSALGKGALSYADYLKSKEEEEEE